MAEIKLNDNFTSEVEAFRASAAALTAVKASDVAADGLSLPTVEAYQGYLKRIWIVINRFSLLLEKDAKDMDALAASLKAADAAGG